MYNTINKNEIKKQVVSTRKNWATLYDSNINKKACTRSQWRVRWEVGGRRALHEGEVENKSNKTKLIYFFIYFISIFLLTLEETFYFKRIVEEELCSFTGMNAKKKYDKNGSRFILT